MEVYAPTAPEADSEIRSLISIDAACARAAGYVQPVSGTEDIPIIEAAGRVLGRSVHANLAMPAFDNAAMDGYALALHAPLLARGSRVPIVGRVAAGQRGAAIVPGHGMRIFTGAPLPVGANAVVMQEHCRREGEDIILLRDVGSGENIRRRGEDIEQGNTLLEAGERLDARHIALLAAQGRTFVTAQRRVRVGVVSTGNELRQPGEHLHPATIFDSNRPMTMALAAQAGANVLDGGWVEDDRDAIAEKLRVLSDCCDLVVTTGGASVGEEDQSAGAAITAGATLERLRIALKPGKPAAVGRLGSAVFLGLPGNPVSALVSWLLLGGAMLAALQDRPFRRRAGYPIELLSRFERRPGRTEFVPARLVATASGPCVEILGRGGSARLRPLAEADGLVEIDAAHGSVERGTSVLFHAFRDAFAI
jgi:molybdopterin molybdotransferase